MVMKAFSCCVACLAGRLQWSARAADSAVCAQLFPADSACLQQPAQHNIMIRAQVTHRGTQPRMLMLQRPLVKHAVGEEAARFTRGCYNRERTQTTNKKGLIVMVDSKRAYSRQKLMTLTALNFRTDLNIVNCAKCIWEYYITQVISINIL